MSSQHTEIEETLQTLDEHWPEAVTRLRAFHTNLVKTLERTERWIVTGCGPSPLAAIRKALKAAKGGSKA